ncbi:MAG: hypothetical protein MJE77_14050 [Proteobacteria bacterium]|nr:hypothetical protein [Pseudomonadota bacterium]
MDSIEIQGLRMLLEKTPTGPILSLADQWLEPLSWVVNSAVTGGIAAGLADALERGDDLFTEGLYAARPEPDDEAFIEDGKKRWREWTGQDAGEDIYVVGTTFSDNAVVIPRLALMEIVTKLKVLHQQAPVRPVPWLFCANPIHPDPGDGEEEILRDLEKRAAELDALVREAAQTDTQNEETRAAISAKRRFLLLDLAAAGLLHEAHETDKRLWLTTWQLPVLLDYFEAALKLRSYFASVDRRAYIENVGVESILGARVSIDWFRLPHPVPEGFRPEQWLGACESFFMHADDLQGGEGEIFVHQNNLYVCLYWRMDDGITPALVSAALLDM